MGLNMLHETSCPPEKFTGLPRLKKVEKTVLEGRMVFSSQRLVWITPGHTLQIASVSANLLFKNSLAEAKSVLFHLCTALISSSWVCISSGHPGGYLWLHCL